MREPLSVDQLREKYDYNPDTGAVILRDTPINKMVNKVLIGKPSGTPNYKGHIVLGRVNNSTLMAHRVAWAMQTGEWPKDVIDHQDGDKSNNRWSNLRVMTNRANCENIVAPQKNSTTGYLGVSVRSQNKISPYVAHIRVNWELIYLGSYKTPEDAHRAYLAGKAKYHLIGIPCALCTCDEKKGETPPYGPLPKCKFLPRECVGSRILRDLSVESSTQPTI